MILPDVLIINSDWLELNHDKGSKAALVDFEP
jgi:hypothetical protein